MLDPVRLVLRWDEAIDHDKCDYDDYQRAHYDYSKLAFLADDKPTVFVLQQLTHEQRIALSTLQRGERAEFAIRYGLKGVENYIIERADGSTYELSNPKREDTPLGKAASAKWLDEARFDDSILAVVAVAIDEISQAQRPFLKPAAPLSGRGDDSNESTSGPPS